jgi:hypothetical protein
LTGREEIANQVVFADGTISSARIGLKQEAPEQQDAEDYQDGDDDDLNQTHGPFLAKPKLRLAAILIASFGAVNPRIVKNC